MSNTTIRRAIVSDEAIVKISAEGWLFTSVATLPDSKNADADCIIVAVEHRQNPQSLTDRTPGIPLIGWVSTAAVGVSDVIDACDDYLLEGDDAATVGRILDAVVAPTGQLQVSDLSDRTARTIGELSIEASRIAEALQMLVARETPGQPEPVTAVTVRKLIRLRRDRDRFLPALLFADPAWDMLLDLTAARLEQREVPVSSLCIAAAVPTTTALRWVRTMTEAGLFERHNDPNDARRNFIRLTDAAADAMLAWLRHFNLHWRAM